ncbi:MAG: Membrane protein related to metalloendopeptidase, partial [Oscillospiraceae bacterium]|nr:Membrane protein related to metalloendopeptidase [Oscillospiraceae bacterium]
MNSPYKGKYRVSQEYKGNAHDGMDLIGVDSKNIYSTINGVVEIAGWENEDNKGQGFGMYIRIKQDNSNDKYYFGHLSAFKCKVGQIVKKGDLIGIEGNTGNSSGSHCHYCVRTNGDKTKHKDVSQLIGIPNEISIYEQIKDGWKKVDKLWHYYKDG